MDHRKHLVNLVFMVKGLFETHSQMEQAKLQKTIQHHISWLEQELIKEPTKCEEGKCTEAPKLPETPEELMAYAMKHFVKASLVSKRKWVDGVLKYRKEKNNNHQP